MEDLNLLTSDAITGLELAVNRITEVADTIELVIARKKEFLVRVKADPRHFPEGEAVSTATKVLCEMLEMNIEELTNILDHIQAAKDAVTKGDQPTTRPNKDDSTDKLNQAPVNADELSIYRKKS